MKSAPADDIVSLLSCGNKHRHVATHGMGSIEESLHPFYGQPGDLFHLKWVVNNQPLEDLVPWHRITGEMPHRPAFLEIERYCLARNGAGTFRQGHPFIGPQVQEQRLGRAVCHREWDWCFDVARSTF